MPTPTESLPLNPGDWSALNDWLSTIQPPGALGSITLPSTGSVLVGSRVTGDTNDRFQIDATGKHSWGPGNAAADVTLSYTPATLNLAGSLKITAPGTGNALEAVANDGAGHVVTMRLPGASMPQSGAQVLELNRGVVTLPVGIAFRTAGVSDWEMGSDAPTGDGVLYYEPFLNGSSSGDVFRFKKGAAFAILGDGVSTPGTASRLQLAALHAIDTATCLLYMSKNASAAALTDFIKGDNNGTVLHQVTANGYGSFGRSFGGELTKGVEVQGGALCMFGVDERVVLRFVRTGTSTQRWELRHTHDSVPANTFGIHDVTNAKRVISFEPNTVADAILVKANGVVQTAKGVQTLTKAGTPVDADWTAAPPDGTLVIDTTASKIWARLGGAWKSATLA